MSCYPIGFHTGGLYFLPAHRRNCDQNFPRRFRRIQKFLPRRFRRKLKLFFIKTSKYIVPVRSGVVSQSNIRKNAMKKKFKR